jgi:SM-20-related protein
MDPRPGFSGLDGAQTAALGAGQALVFDGVLGHARARALAAHLSDPAQLSAARVGRGAGRQHAPEVRGDRTRWLTRSSSEPLAALFELFDQIAANLRERAWLGIEDYEVQLALYPGAGERYAPHRDAFAGQGRRRATAIYYLNPHWQPEDGGELQLAPSPGEPTPPPIAPLLDRLVLFLAERVEHEVRATRAPRWAATAWFLGPPTAVPR